MTGQPSPIGRPAAAKVIGIFPTPVLKVDRLVPPDLIEVFVRAATASERAANPSSDALSHTAMIDPDGTEDGRRLAALAGPHLVAFGQLLFGENLRWLVKELWVNVLEPGGHQSMHAHANSFVSGVVYLTRTHPSASTVFHKAPGGADFAFGNQNPRAAMGPFNAGRWVMPEAEPGDLVLFPSYLLHEVPRNRGERRVSLAFNAIPDRLDNFGYTIRFGK